MGRPRINPRTREEWQEAVNAAHFGLLLDSAFQYGLIEWDDGRKDSGICRSRCEMGRPRINPRTREEWQEAVNAAHFGLLLDSAFQYGLIEWDDGRKDSGINVDRCLRILDQGKRKGFTPEEVEIL